MSEDSGSRQVPVLKDLVDAAKPSKGQNFVNFIGLGYVGNTAVAVVAVKLVRKLFPKLSERMEARYAQKYYDRKFEEFIAPVKDELDEKSRTMLEEKIKADAEVYGEKTWSSRLLITGGFAMLPFQSAMEVQQHKKNVGEVLDQFRDQAKANGFNELEAEDLLNSAVATQKSDVIAENTLKEKKDRKPTKVFEDINEPPEFSPFGKDARKGLTKWGTGRVLAVGSAFLVQSFVDDRFAKPKDAIDTMLAKIFTKIVHPKGYNKGDFENKAFAEAKAPSTAPEGVDPKVLDVVRMVTTDAYMTTVAVLVQKNSNKLWDKHFEEKGPLQTLRDHFSQNSRSA